jgi:hypothetical protein
MHSIRILPAGLLLLMIAAGALGQGTPQHLAKEGLSFDYPAGWTLSDESNSDAQQFSLGKPNSDAQLKVFVHRGKAETPEKLAKAKTAFIDPYIKSINDTFVSFGGTKPESKPTTVPVGAVQAEGVQLSTSLGGEKGEATIAWLALGDRVVILTFLGPDAALKAAMPAWEMIRTSIKVEPPPPKSAPKKP